MFGLRTARRGHPPQTAGTVVSPRGKAEIRGRQAQGNNPETVLKPVCVGNGSFHLEDVTLKHVARSRTVQEPPIALGTTRTSLGTLEGGRLRVPLQASVDA